MVYLHDKACLSDKTLDKYFPYPVFFRLSYGLVVNELVDTLRERGIKCIWRYKYGSFENSGYCLCFRKEKDRLDYILRNNG